MGATSDFGDDAILSSVSRSFSIGLGENARYGELPEREVIFSLESRFNRSCEAGPKI